MRVKKSIGAKDKDGEAQLICEVPEDLWHVFNIVAVGDLVRASTVRKVMREGTTGSTSAVKKRTTLTIEVASIDFDPENCTMRIGGRNKVENQYVKMNAYHTIDLQLYKAFTVIKSSWDQVFLDRLKAAADPARDADLAAVILDVGKCVICVVSEHMTVDRARFEVSVPKKRAGASGHQKGMTKFFQTVYQAVLRHVDFEKAKAIVVASPGFVKDDFLKFMLAEATKTGEKAVLEARPKFLLIHTTGANKRALKEVLADPGTSALLADTKAAKEVAVLNSFFKMLHSDPERAYYGFKHVKHAADSGAVETLMLSDNLFRSSDIKERRQYVELVELVRGAGGSVLIFSSLHVSGEQLAQISGVAALLRFPVHMEEDGEGESDYSDSDSEADLDLSTRHLGSDLGPREAGAPRRAKHTKF